MSVSSVQKHISSASLPNEAQAEVSSTKLLDLSNLILTSNTPPNRKIQTSEVYAAIKPKMCLVETSKGKATGFFINEKGLLVTSFHCLEKTLLPNNKFTVSTGNVSVTCNGNKYSVQFPEGFNATKAAQLDLCLLKIHSDEPLETSCFDFLPDNGNIKEGMKTYFAGYPLTQSAITFHKGLISSIFINNNIQQFTIDGTVVPGNSGGPVIVNLDNRFYLAGIIFSEVADLDPQFLFLEDSFAIMRQQGGIGGISIGLLYPDGAVRSTSPMDILSTCLTVVKRNMSTGIGKAIHSQHIKELVSNSKIAFELIGPEQNSKGKELPVHGTMQVTTIVKEGVKKIPSNIINNAIDFIRGFTESIDKKKDLYSKLSGSIATLYNFEGGRLDRQSPLKDATNLQIQIDSYTVATILISDQLTKYTSDQEIAEVINYVVRQFEWALSYYRYASEAIVLRLDPK